MNISVYSEEVGDFIKRSEYHSEETQPVFFFIIRRYSSNNWVGVENQVVVCVGLRSVSWGTRRQKKTTYICFCETWQLYMCCESGAAYEYSKNS